MTAALRVPALVLWLVVLWVGLWGDVSVANVLSGLIVALVVTLSARSTGARALTSSRFRPFAAVRFAGYFLVKLVQANLVLAWEILTPRNRIHTGIIGVPTHGLSDPLVTLVANAITLTPGTLTVEVLADPAPTIYVHVLHLHDVARVRREVVELQYLAARAFGSPADIERLAAARAEVAA